MVESNDCRHSDAAFASEQEFEKHLRRFINSHVLSGNSGLRTLQGKAIGDIVIVRDGPSPALFFLEVKYRRASNARLGFGDATGGGIQAEILKERPAYLETHLRWVIGSDAHIGRYWLIAAKVMAKFAAGGSIGPKQNNIQQRLFRECPSVDEGQLAEQLRHWLLS